VLEYDRGHPGAIPISSTCEWQRISAEEQALVVEPFVWLARWQ
jgi:hypothetical protein